MRGLVVCAANSFNVASPIPLVAPIKTAMREGGREAARVEFEALMVDRGIILWLQFGIL